MANLSESVVDSACGVRPVLIVQNDKGYVDRFEQNICNKIGCDAAVALSSGTAALHLALVNA